MTNESAKTAREEIQEVKELRALLKQIPRKAKENILKGIFLFEAGYHIGYLDGVNSEGKQDFV